MTPARHGTRTRGRLSPARAAVGAAIVCVTAGGALIGLGLTHREAAPRALPHSFAAPPSAVPRIVPPSAVPRVVAPSAPVDTAGSSVPKRLEITSLHVHAPIVPVASSTDGELGVPDRPGDIGWWTAGAAPGAGIGTAVLVGHVDSARTGPGALFHLDEIGRERRIDIRNADGRRVSYRVAALQIVHKSSGLPPGLFASDGPPRLVVITCGGPFDRRTRSYQDNIVAVATRA